MYKFILLISILTTSTYAGNETGNGGDHIAQDFVLSATKAFEVLEQKHSYFPFIDLLKIKNSIESAKIDLLKSGESFPSAIRTAENFPSRNLIKINIDRWTQIKDPVRKMALSIHEYLGLTGYEINNYAISGFLFGYSSDDIELPPTISELEKSFLSIKNSQIRMLDRASNLKLIPLRSLGKKLSQSECEGVVDNNINEHEHVKYNLRYNCHRDTHYLNFSKGRTQLKQEYDLVLSEEIKVLYDGSYVRESLYINEEGIVTQKVELRRKQNGEIEIKISAKDKDGNIYSKKVQRSEKGEIKKELVEIMLADGSLGMPSRRLIEYSQNGTRTETRFSQVNTFDWNNLQMSLVNISQDGWSFRDGFSFTYEYLDSYFETPDNFRTLSYSKYFNSNLKVSGRYFVNRRFYEIKE